MSSSSDGAGAPHPDGTSQTLRQAVTRSAIDTGRSALSAATTGARSGARLAVGTLFAGANVLLDLGVRATRFLPIEGGGNGVHLETEQGPLTAEVRSCEEAPGAPGLTPIGWWSPDEAADVQAAPASGDASLADALARVKQSVYIVSRDGRPAVASNGFAVLGADTASAAAMYPLLAWAPAVDPGQLGDPAFRRAHGLTYAYIAGAMANGIGSEAIVEAMSRAGMLGFFGAAGLPLRRVEAAADRLSRNLGDAPFGMNLIHSPNEPRLESGVVDLYLKRGIRLVSASAYLDLTPPLVRYRVSGIHRDASGRVVCPNRVIAKVSRVEVARKFMSPPPVAMLRSLAESGQITAEEARLGASVPVATDMTVEADSGGHTDNRPAIALIPTMIALRDEMQAAHGYSEALRVGAAGGIATPASVAAAFSMGAAYVLTGSINQACVEAGTSDAVKRMLAEAGQADVTMAPAADMFEMGVKLQVLKRGTMFAMRARKLFELYRAHASLDEIAVSQRRLLERDYFRASLDEAWAQTRLFFEERDPSQIARADSEPKHKMALVFRSYLGRSSEWANTGDSSRKVDYQVWCGPAMGAFNEWARGSALAAPENRRVADIGLNLMYGAAVLARINWLRSQGVPLSAAVQAIRPRTAAEIQSYLDN